MYSGFTVMTAEQWQEAVTAPGRRVKTKVVINNSVTLYGDSTDGAVVSIMYDEQMEASTGLGMGGAVASQCKVGIRQPSTPVNLANSTFIPYVGLTYQGMTEYVPLGEFFASAADSDNGGGVVTITGYDRFCKLTDTYEPTIDFPATITAVMNDMASHYGFTWSGSLSNKTLDVYRNGTVRDYIGWIAGLEGKNARFNRSGVLEFVYYATQSLGYTISGNEQYMGGAQTQTVGDVLITALVSGTDEAPLQAGTGRSITFSNPYMTQTILDGLYSSLIGNTAIAYRPMELQWRGNPALQCGDVVKVMVGSDTVTALVMAHTLAVDGGMKDTLRCFGQSDTQLALDKTPTERKIAQALSALQTEIARATALLNGTVGGIFEITEENGINTGWKIKESSSPNYIGNVIVANYNGIGFSTDGGGTYRTAITTDGHINGQFISANSVSIDALNVGDTSTPFMNYVYIGRRRPNDDTTDMVIRLGVASQSMVQEIRGNRTSMFLASDIADYIAGNLTDAQLDAKALMYYSDTDYVLLNLGSFRIGNMLMQAQANGGVKFIKARD